MTISGIPAGSVPINPVSGANPARTSVTQREPTLWTMLSNAERAFFLAPDGDQALGYGPAGGNTIAAPALGSQLDVRG